MRDAIGPDRLYIGIPTAGRSPKLLAHAGAATDGVLLEFLHKPSLGQYVDHVRAGAASAGASSAGRIPGGPALERGLAAKPTAVLASRSGDRPLPTASDPTSSPAPSPQPSNPARPGGIYHPCI